MILRPVAVVLAFLVVAAVPTAANASTISGKVAGAKMPKGKKGFTTVRAVRAKDLVIARVAKVRSGHFKLTVPAGSYWLLGATTPVRGKKGVDPGGSKVTVRKGKRKTVRVSLRKHKHPRPRLPHLPHLHSAHAAFVTVKYPAVWVQHFTVTGAPDDYGVLRKGIADMLITDLIPPIAAGCKGVIVEREKLDWIIAEQLLSQSRFGDPSTRIPSDKMIGHNREVTGNLSVAGGTSTLTVVVKNVVTGTSRSVSRSAPNDRFFELETSVVEETARLICGDKPPVAYSGPASGSMSGSDGSSSQTLSWNGNVRLKFTEDLVPESAGDPPGEYAIYEPESGGIHVILDGTDGPCSYHGTADVTIVPHPGEQSRVQQGVDEPTYSLLATFPANTPPLVFTMSGPTPDCSQGTSIYPLAGRVFLGMATGGSQRSPNSTLNGTSSFVIGPVTTKWGWSLGPQAH
jgi:hypothetical protein